MAKRLYPFSEPLNWSNNATGTTNSSYCVSWSGAKTVYKPNPFHGLDRWIFAVDEWAHRHGLVMTNGEQYGRWKFWLIPFSWLCNYWDKRMLDGDG